MILDCTLRDGGYYNNWDFTVTGIISSGSVFTSQGMVGSSDIFPESIVPDSSITMNSSRLPFVQRVDVSITKHFNLYSMNCELGLSVFNLFDRKNIINSFMAIIPGERKMLSNVWLEMDNQLSNYVRGKSIEILIVAVASAIIFASLGLNYTALLSVLVGVSVLIPYVGAFLVTIPVLVVGLIQFGLSADFYILTGLYLLLQALDGNLLVPLIFSDAVKLHPVVIILAVFIFGSMFGFWGVFLAIPIATFIKAIWNAWPSQA